jgi:putative membrane protein
MNQFKNGVYNWTSGKLRLWNELATLFLVAIVFIVVLKSTMNWIYGTIGFFATGVLLMLGIKLYKSLRQKR